MPHGRAPCTTKLRPQLCDAAQFASAPYRPPRNSGVYRSLRLSAGAQWALCKWRVACSAILQTKICAAPGRACSSLPFCYVCCIFRGVVGNSHAMSGCTGLPSGIAVRKHSLCLLSQIHTHHSLPNYLHQVSTSTDDTSGSPLHHVACASPWGTALNRHTFIHTKLWYRPSLATCLSPKENKLGRGVVSFLSFSFCCLEFLY